MHVSISHSDHLPHFLLGSKAPLLLWHLRWPAKDILQQERGTLKRNPQGELWLMCNGSLFSEEMQKGILLIHLNHFHCGFQCM